MAQWLIGQSEPGTEYTKIQQYRWLIFQRLCNTIRVFKRLPFNNFNILRELCKEVGRFANRSDTDTEKMAGLLEEIGARHDKIILLIEEGKKQEVLECYTDDCVLMPPEQEALQGKEALLNFIEASAEFQSKIGKIENVEEEILGEGDVVTSRSKGTIYGKDGSVIFKRKALAVWKKVEGNFLIQTVIWNFDKAL